MLFKYWKVSPISRIHWLIWVKIYIIIRPILLFIISRKTCIFMLLIGFHLLQGWRRKSKVTINIKLMVVTFATKYLVLRIPKHIGEGKRLKNILCSSSTPRPNIKDNPYKIKVILLLQTYIVNIKYHVGPW